LANGDVMVEGLGGGLSWHDKGVYDEKAEASNTLFYFLFDNEKAWGIPGNGQA